MARLRTTAAAIALGVLAVGMAAPAAANENFYPTFIRAGFVQTDMKPIPGTDANNTGLGKPADRIDVICQIDDNHGVRWDLVINRSGRAGQQWANTVGFVRFNDTFGGYTWRACNEQVWQEIAVVRTTLRPYLAQSDMKPIAGTDANNTGLARSGDTLDIICSLRDNHGLRWDLVLNRNGRDGLQHTNTVGFVRYSDTNGIYSTPSC
jgi:cytochrome c2